MAISLLYGIAWVVALTSHANDRNGIPFALGFLVPAALIWISLDSYRGPKRVHWLQLVNACCLLWTGIVGGMAVTGRWI
jgi:hypothetical protein